MLTCCLRGTCGSECHLLQHLPFAVLLFVGRTGGGGRPQKITFPQIVLILFQSFLCLLQVSPFPETFGLLKHGLLFFFSAFSKKNPQSSTVRASGLSC